MTASHGRRAGASAADSRSAAADAPGPPPPIDRRLVERARSLASGGSRALLGITGPPGAGKSTLARTLVLALDAGTLDAGTLDAGTLDAGTLDAGTLDGGTLDGGTPGSADVGADGRASVGAAGRPAGAPASWVAHVPMDGFHLADAALARLGRLERKGAPDTFDVAGYAALLRRLHERSADPVWAPAFERDLEQPLAAAIGVPPQVRLVVTEGNYLLLDGVWRAARAQLDEVWFVELDEDERVRRLVDRHVRYGKDRASAAAWVDAVDRPNAELVLADRDRADVIVGDWQGQLVG
jgi:pantothenate kinase